MGTRKGFVHLAHEAWSRGVHVAAVYQDTRMVVGRHEDIHSGAAGGNFRA
jgi:hypothetical protein